MLPRFQCRALGLKLGMRRSGCSDNVTGDVNQWLRQRRKDVVSKAVGESVHSHLDQYYFLSSKLQSLQPYLPHCTRVIMKKKSCPPSSFLHGLLRYYRCPKGAQVHIKRGRDTSPRWATEECRPVRCLETQNEAGMARDWRPCRRLRIPWLISHEIPTLARTVNRGGSSRTVFRAARPGWPVASLGWHVALPRGMAGIFHPGFSNVAYQIHHQRQPRAQACCV